MAKVAKQDAQQGWEKAVDYHIGPEYDETVEYVESELEKYPINYDARELLAEMVAAGGVLAGLHLRDFTDSALTITGDDIEIDLMLDDHASDDVLAALEWIERGDEVRARLESMTLGWVRKVVEQTL